MWSGPEMLHFSQAPRWCCRTMDRTWSSNGLGDWMQVGTSRSPLSPWSPRQNSSLSSLLWCSPITYLGLVLESLISVTCILVSLDLVKIPWSSVAGWTLVGSYVLKTPKSLCCQLIHALQSRHFTLPLALNLDPCHLTNEYIIIG